MKYILILLIPLAALANEPKCLSEILHAEAQGEPLEGLIAVGQATITRAGKTPVCKVQGVKRKELPKALREYYLALSTQLLSTRATSVSLGADSWSTRPRKGQTRKIKNHHFYRSHQ